jgi:hypothetical protein
MAVDAMGAYIDCGEKFTRLISLTNKQNSVLSINPDAIGIIEF